MSKFYRLDSLENKDFKPIKRLSEVEYVELEKCVQTVLDFYLQFSYFLYFHLNLSEYNKLKKSISNIPVATINLQTILNGNYKLNINRVVSNLLASFSFFIDSSETYIKRKFGKNSIESKNFIKKTHESFDNSFAYRFLSRLRDYSQHISFPIQIVPFEAGENKIEPHKMKGEFKLIIQRDILLNEKTILRKIVYEDLLKLKGNLDVSQYIFELSEILFDFEKMIYDFHKKTLEESINYIEEQSLAYKSDNNQLVVMNDLNFETETPQFSMLILPYDKINEIKRFVNWKKWR